MTGFTEFIRNVAVVGHLHHGKTTLMDMLVFETHKLDWDSDNQVSSQTACIDAITHGAYSRRGTQILTFSQENGVSQSSRRLCP